MNIRILFGVKKINQSIDKELETYLVIIISTWHFCFSLKSAEFVVMSQSYWL